MHEPVQKSASVSIKESHPVGSFPRRSSAPTGLPARLSSARVAGFRHRVDITIAGIFGKFSVLTLR